LKNVFNEMTQFSVARPKTALGIILVLILALVPNAMFISFDNSEDAFFPDNETVRLLNEVEDEYQASIDFIRFIDDIEAGDLYQNSTWEQLAILEAILLENPDLKQYEYPLFGVQANSGMASTAIQWHKIQDQNTASSWINNLNSAINDVTTSDNDTLNLALANLSSASTAIPTPTAITADQLRNWQPEDPKVWLDRIDSGDNLSGELSISATQLSGLIQGPNSSEIAMVVGPISGKLGILTGMQSVDYRAIMISNLPADDSAEPWQSDGPVLTTFVVVTDPAEYGVEVTGEVQEIITTWAESLSGQAINETGDSDVSVFSFSQLSTGQNSNLGKELAILNSLCLLLLGLILWSKFRSKRDTFNVLILTVFAILATYGMAGLITLLGNNMVFNAAMNSIPILLLAIGVEY
jgi:predicted RND superfamily exporter protein